MRRVAKATRAASFFVLAATFWQLTACPGPEPSEPARASLDLIPIYQSARLLAETGSIRLSSHRSDFHLGRGWFEQTLRSGGRGRTAVAVAGEAVLRYRVLRPAGRWLAFNARSRGRLGGPERQHVEVFAGGRRLASLEISGAQDRLHSVRIPAEAQNVGENELLLRFSAVEANPGFLAGREKNEESFYPGTAAYFSRMTIFFGDEEGPREDEVRDESRVFELTGGGRSLSQRPNSELAYAFEIGEGSRLAFAGSVRDQAGADDEITVTVRGRTDSEPAWRALWSRTFPGGTGHAFEAELPLAELARGAGGAAELSFGVAGSRGFSHATVVWRRLSLEAPPEAAPGPRRRAVRMGGRVGHVVIIVLDAARPDHFGCYGDGRGITPRIDEFARSAVVFSQAVAPAPYTPTSISSLFCGLLPERHGVRRDNSSFPEELLSMPGVFGGDGYFTLCLTGSPYVTPTFGLGRDFERLLYLRRPEYLEAGTSAMDLEAAEQGIAAAAASGRPAFIYVHLLPPHWPYLPPEPFDSLHVVDAEAPHRPPWKIRLLLDYGIIDSGDPEIANMHLRYTNNLSYADHVVGRLLEMLRSHGLYDDALVIVTADHGEAFGEHGGLLHRTHVYDEMIRVPLVVRAPGLEPAAVERQVGLVDIFPTLVELMGLEVEGAVFQGRSFAPLLAGGEAEPAGYYYSRAVGTRLNFSLRGERYKYIYQGGREFLYDLPADPGETENVIGRRPVLAALLRLRGMLAVAAEAEGPDSRIQLDPEMERELRDLGYLQ